MERLTDILNNIKDRVSNPLIFSFMVSWTAINWKIVVSLLWYDNLQIKNAGYDTIYSFIEANLNPSDGFWNPLVLACTYTFGFPLVKIVVRGFYTLTAKWGNNLNLILSKEGKVGIESYLKLRDNYDKRTKVLEEVIASESVTRGEFETLKTELLKIQSESIDIKNRENELRNSIMLQNDYKILNGYWVIKYTDESGAFNGEQEIFIDNGHYSYIKSFGEKEEMFYISNFSYDSVNKRVFFVKELTNQKNKVTQKLTISELIFERDDLLTGRENRSVKIEYKRK